jgi:hypothetical protein
MQSVSLQLRVDTIGYRISLLAARLEQLGFRFERPGGVFPGPERHALSAIERIESAVGSLPQSLKLFWLRVGSVEFSGHHPQWQGCEYLDQLIVFPPSAAVQELEEFLSDREERRRSNDPYSVPIAPDIFHKADVSGGSPYSIAVPATGEDPPLLNAAPAASFLEHIERALRYGGFPGLADCAHHTWPLAELVRDER